MRQTRNPHRAAPAVAGGSARSVLRPLLWMLLLAGLLSVGVVDPAQSAVAEVRLSGDDGNNFFSITPAAGGKLEFCSDIIGCFERLQNEISGVAIDAFDGDDILVISHDSGFVTNGVGDLTLTFTGGPGADELSVCDFITDCTTEVTTNVSATPENDEVRIVQCQGAVRPGGRCYDSPFPGPDPLPPTLKISARGTTVVRDIADGPLHVVGTAGVDTVTFGTGVTYDPTAGDVPSGQVRIGTAAGLRYLHKTSVTMDAGDGADRIQVDALGGMAATTSDCTPDGRAVPVCVHAGAAGGDVVAVAASAAETETLTLTPREPAGADVSARALLSGPALGSLDLSGVDDLQLAMQPAGGDSFRLRGSPGDDAFEWRATTPGVLTLAGTLSLDTAPVPVPAVTLTSDRGAPLAVAIDGLDGDDRAALTTGAGADTLAAGPAEDSADCGAAFGSCIEHAADGTAEHVMVTTGIDTIDAATGSGSDVLAARGNLRALLTWQAGGESDRLAFTGTGIPVTADLGAGTVAQDGSAGRVVVSAAEILDVDVAGSSMVVRGTAGADTLRYTPVDASRGTLALDGDPRTVNALGVAGILRLDPAEGDDTVAVSGTTGADSIAVFRGSSTVAQVDATLPARAQPTTESLVVSGRSGDDRFIVNGDGGTAEITIDGGISTGGDRLSFAAAVSSAAVTFDATPASGTLAAGGPAIAFRELEHIDAEGDEAGTFTVNGSDSTDAIVQEGGTVTVGRGTTATFTRYPTLALNGLAGDDDVVLSPRSLPVGVGGVVVGGGDAGTDTVVVRGTELRETIVYTPDGPSSGTVAMSLAPTVDLAGVESVEVDGRTAPPSGDTLLITSPAVAGTIVASPGMAVDSGSIALIDATGPVTSVPPLRYGGLAAGSVIISGADGAGSAGDAVRVQGESDIDVFSLTGESGGARVVLDDRIPVVTSAVHTVGLRGGDGQDTFHVPAAHGLVGAPGPAIVVDGGPPSGGDVAIVTGADAGLVVDLASRTLTHAGSRAMAFSGLDRIDLQAAGQPANFVGGSGADQFSARPTTPDGAHVTSDLVATLVNLTGASALTVDARDGADALTVTGRTVADDVTIARGGTSVVAVGDLLPVRAAPSVEAVRVEGQEGADTMTVTGAGGPPSLALDGGQPAADGDQVRVVSPDVTVAFDDPATAGSLATPGGNLAFGGFDTIDVVGDDSGLLVVRGTDGPDTVTTGDPGTPAVRVNAGAAVTHVGYPTLTLDGRGGHDDIAISYANLGDLGTVNAAGGTSADDHVRITDTLGSTRTFDLRPADADHATVDATGGVPTVVVTGADGVTVNGRGAGDLVRVLTPDGAQDVDVTPGPGVDGGTVRVGSLIPLTFSTIGTDGALHVNEPASSSVDHVRLAGTAVADGFSIIGSDAEVRLTGFVPLRADGTAQLSLRGLDGADTFAGTGPLPWARTTVEGGEPSSGDHLAMDGPIGDAIVDVGRTTVTGYGGVVSFPEVSTLATDHANRGLTLVGTDRDDAICVDPLTPRDGRAHIIAQPGGGLLTDSCQPAAGSLDVLHTFIDVGLLVLDPGIGADQVLVSGTVNDDAVIIESTGPEAVVTVHPNPAETTSVRLPVHVVTASTENVIVATDNGNDEVDVRLYEAVAPVFTVHGEAPDSRRADTLIVRDLSGGANINVVNGDPQSSGTVTVDWRRYSGIQITVNYTGMEWVRTYKIQRPK